MESRGQQGITEHQSLQVPRTNPPVLQGGSEGRVPAAGAAGTRPKKPLLGLPGTRGQGAGQGCNPTHSHLAGTLTRRAFIAAGRAGTAAACFEHFQLAAEPRGLQGRIQPRSAHGAQPLSPNNEGPQPRALPGCDSTNPAAFGQG